MKTPNYFNKFAIALLAGSAIFAAFELTSAGITTPAFAQPVKITAPAQPGFAEVVDKVSPAVVSVRVKGPLLSATSAMNQDTPFGDEGFDQLPNDHPLKRFFREYGGPNQNNSAKPNERMRAMPTSQGSGFFISDDGFVVTNNHVVENGTEFVVVLKDGREMDAKLIGKDQKTDLAVLKVEATDKFPYVAFALENQARVGDWVVAVGNPFGLGGTVTAGIVSALGRDIGAGPYDDFLQIDAAVNHGNSGGPAFNLSGEVVGVNTAIFSPTGGNVGIAFSIPAKTAYQVVNDLIKDGSIKRGWLGVQIQPVTSEIADSIGLKTSSGALINQVQADSPAANAGLQVGDVVLSVSGKTISDPKDLARTVAAIVPGNDANIVVWRAGAEKSLRVEIKKLADTTIAAATEQGANPKYAQELTGLGLKVIPNDSGKGIVITDMDPNAVAVERGLKIGDVIVAVNNTSVANADDLSTALAQASKAGRKAILVRVESEAGSRFVALPIMRG